MNWRTVRDESHFDTETSIVDEKNRIVAQAVDEESARLIAAAPIGYEIAEAIVAMKRDGLDRMEWITKRAEDFIAAADGK